MSRREMDAGVVGHPRAPHGQNASATLTTGTPIKQEEAPMKEQNASSSEEPSPQVSLSEYLSVEEAARILGVTTCSVYWYIERGRLSCTQIETSLLRREEVIAFERRSPGRARTRALRWRVPPVQNALLLTTITVRVQPGQRQPFMEKLAAMHQQGKHLFPGTAARSIAYNPHDPDEITILLVWRQANQSVPIPCQEALAALMADLAEVVDRDTVHIQEWIGLLHA